MSWAQCQARQLPVVSGVTRHLFLFLCCISYIPYKLGDSTLKKKKQKKKNTCSLKFPDHRLSDSGDVL